VLTIKVTSKQHAQLKKIADETGQPIQKQVQDLIITKLSHIN